jgi:16S rRNA G1207 methylase RsmC
MYFGPPNFLCSIFRYIRDRINVGSRLLSLPTTISSRQGRIANCHDQLPYPKVIPVSNNRSDGRFSSLLMLRNHIATKCQQSKRRDTRCQQSNVAQFDTNTRQSRRPYSAVGQSRIRQSASVIPEPRQELPHSNY